MSRQPIERIRLAQHLPEPLSHYTDAVRAGDTIWVSGLLPVDRSGTLIGGSDVAAQAEQIFHNLALILDSQGVSFDDVVKVVVYVVNVEHRAPINEIRKRHFGVALPASTLVGVSALAIPEALLEVDAVVYAPRVADDDQPE